MPHQCVKCSALYSDDAPELVGCPCGSKAFFFLKNETSISNLHISEQEREEVLAQSEKADTPIILDLETISMTADGKYDLDLHALFGKNELIMKEEEGKYSINLEESFRRHRLEKH